MVALLPLVPLRLKNFAALELGRTLIQRGQTWWIAVPGTETKNGRPYERPFPERLLAHLQHYLREIHPALARRQGRWARPVGQALWISTHASPMGEDAIRQQIVLRTGNAFGTPVNPQLFRHSAATSLAVANPDAVRLGAVILGHATFATTEKHYNLSRTMDASRRYQKVIDDLASRRQRR